MRVSHFHSLSQLDSNFDGKKNVFFFMNSNVEDIIPVNFRKALFALTRTGGSEPPLAFPTPPALALTILLSWAVSLALEP